LKYRLMDLLLCPECRRQLDLKVFEVIEKKYEKNPVVTCKNFCHLYKAELGNLEPNCKICYGSEIVEGLLRCACGRRYPIINGVPRLLPDRLIGELAKHHSGFLRKHHIPVRTDGKDAKEKEKTFQSFSFQWQEFSEMYEEWREDFLEYFDPIRPSFFECKLVLEVGCGFGRHTYHAAEYGSEIVAFDLSEAVNSAYENTREFPNVHVVQGDLYKLPFKNDFDFVFSIGVLHHLPDPRGGFLNIVKFTKSGSSIFIWVYGREGRWFKVNVVERIREITKRIPHRMLYYLCFLPASIYHFGLNVPYNILNRYDLTKNFAERIPAKDYAKFPFRVKVADAFDLLATPINNYYTREELSEWFKEAGLKNVRLISLKGKSWKGIGEKVS
jgi:SAM-dependent methyltransferase/uncharacterized protein YbaR (Trm112 family)